MSEQNKTSVVYTRVTDDTHARMKDRAEAVGSSVSDWVRAVIEDALRKDPRTVTTSRRI